MDRHRLARFLELEPAERRLTVRTAWWLTLVRFGLLLLPARLVVRAPELRARFAGPPPGPLDVDRAVRRAGSVIPGTRCLARSIAAAVLLTGGTEQPVIRFAVRRTDGRLEAHAWVEVGGQLAAGDPPADGFVPMNELPR